MTDTDYADDLALLTNALKRARVGIGLYVNVDKTMFGCLKEEGTILTLCVQPLKLVHQFKLLGSNISSIESDVNIIIGNT